MADYVDFTKAYDKSGQPTPYPYTKDEWIALDANKKKMAMKGLKNQGSTVNTSSITNSSSSSVLNSQSVQTMTSLLTLTGLQGDENQRNAEMLDMTVKFLEKEGKIRKTIVQDLGQMGIAQEQTVKLIADASVEAALFGIEYTKIVDTVSELSKAVGRNVGLSEEDVKRAAIFSESMNLSLYSVGQMVKQFDLMNISVEGAIEKGTEMAEVARNMGLNMESFMSVITDNMDMLNTYNFADGVKGFAKMAAQAQRLGLSMSTTAALAEKVMDPEGAIELAANLQVIGGAVGNLADPFKLMYMATNDVAGLQDALVNVGKDLVIFNEATGEMSIPPTAQRQMRAYAETLNMSKEEFAEMIKLQSKFDSVVNQMNFSAFTKEMEDSGVGEYIASIARMNEGSGKYQVQVDGMFKNVDLLTPEDMKALQKEAQIDTENKAKSEREIMLEQLTVLDSINNALSGVDAQMFATGMNIENFNPSEIGKQSAGAVVESMKKTLPKLGGEMAKFFTIAMKGVFEGNSEESMDWANMGKKIADGFTTSIKFGMTAASTVLEMANDQATTEIKTEKADDFTVSEGQTQAVITSKGMIIPSKKDTLIGVDLSASPSMPNMGALNSTTTSNQTITLNTNTIKIDPIDLKLDGRNLGKMSGREIVDAIFANQTNAIILKEGLKSINPITASSGINESNSPFG